VEDTSSSYSALNEGADFVFTECAGLVGTGTGRNYGLELTVEKFLSKGYYALITASVFDSRYTGSDGVERNTGFANEYVLNALFGKEWAGQQRALLVQDARATGPLLSGPRSRSAECPAGPSRSCGRRSSCPPRWDLR
jgi:hypothetical protein